jgi:RNA polymerase sigma-70 factor (ECF subfamily)
MDVEELPEPGSANSSPLSLLMSEQSNATVQALLAMLSAEQRLLVELKVFQGMTFDEIAELQDISANTAKTRFYSALKKLRVMLENSDDMP